MIRRQKNGRQYTRLLAESSRMGKPENPGGQGDQANWINQTRIRARRARAGRVLFSCLGSSSFFLPSPVFSLLASRFFLTLSPVFFPLSPSFFHLFSFLFLLPSLFFLSCCLLSPCFLILPPCSCLLCAFVGLLSSFTSLLSSFPFFSSFFFPHIVLSGRMHSRGLPQRAGKGRRRRTQTD